MGHSIPPGAPRESVGNLVEKLQKAVAAGDPAAEQRRLERLGAAVHSYDGLCRRYGLDDPDQIAEARQLTLIKLHRALRRGRSVDKPEGWARVVARNTIIDIVRRKQRQARRERVLDPERTAYPAENQEPEPDPELLERRMFKLFLYCVFVTRRGKNRRRNELRVKELSAWYLLRIVHRPANEVAHKLGATHLSGGGLGAVYKWAERGAQRVRQIAEFDPEHPCAEALRIAAEARW